MQTKVDDIFARAAARNRAASIATEARETPEERAKRAASIAAGLTHAAAQEEQERNARLDAFHNPD